MSIESQIRAYAKRCAEKSKTAGVLSDSEWQEVVKRKQLEDAAPDLLAELKAILGEIEQNTGYNRQDEIRAAIARAEGKEDNEGRA